MNKILIVSNDYAIRLLYREELTWDGYEVITASGGEGLLKIIDQHRPDLIVLDINMKEVNGLDLLQNIRKTYYNLPLILCTAYRTAEYKPESAPAEYYVVKSSDLSELRLKIQMAMEGKREFLENTTPEKVNKGTALPLKDEQMELPLKAGGI